ncbi:hypothetical protein AB1L16_06890 [Peribacillus frigoritolerans]
MATRYGEEESGNFYRFTTGILWVSVIVGCHTKESLVEFTKVLINFSSDT